MKILAIDLGKMKSVACDYESETARTEPAILEDLFRRHQPDGVVIDVGPAAGWVTDLAARMKIELQVANPSHQAWR
ncbi:MAG: IS110 family transposase, partial [Planctomycetes bacterium]|nr:IS110 family transposase [Planctomycetota bacterium]